MGGGEGFLKAHKIDQGPRKKCDFLEAARGNEA